MRTPIAFAFAALALAAALAAPVAARPTSQAQATPRPTAAPAPAPTPSAAASPTAAAPRRTTTTLDQLTKLLDEAKLDYHREGGHLRVTFRWSDDRSQAIVLQPQPDIDELPVVEIYSGVTELDAKTGLTVKIAQRLLQASGDQTLGYFGVEDVERKPWVFAYHNLPTKNLQAQTLEKVLRLVAELADEMEKELTGGKDDF